MAYASEDSIEAAHYNAFATSLNAVWGTGSGVRGLGQSDVVAAVSAGDSVTAAGWATLLTRLKSLSDHQGNDGNITIDSVTNPSAGDSIAVIANIATDIGTLDTSAAAGTNAAVYKLTNLKLDSESFSSSIGPNKTVDLTFSISVGGPDDLENNLFFSGANTDAKFALQPVKLNGGGLAAGESVSVNGVVFDYEASPKTTGEQIVGYVHGQTSRSFPVFYTGAADLDLTAVAGGAITGTAEDVLTGASGAAGGTLSFAPTDKTANADITGTISLS